MFAADDEDGDFMSPTGGAKLASLFGLDQTGSQANESFQYTAPKQPRKSSGPPAQKAAPPPGSPAVLFATAVHAYRYVNGQYMKQGKLGAAVLGNHPDKEYKLLLYASQQKPVTAARIHSGFYFTVQPSNYCTFYDDQRQNWSLMFESEKVATDFCKEVCLAKANCASPLEVPVTQDLVPGEGQGVENGDSLEVAYTGWLLQNRTIGQMFDSNVNKDKLLRIKLGSGKVIKGWEEGMLNMRKGGRRLLVIPPALAYGSQGVPGRVPPDSTLVFEAEIRRVKFAKDTGSERTSVSSRDTAVPSPAPSVESLGPDLTSAASRAGEPPLRAKSNSLSEQLANPDATKAKLISRMAKMGQPMLPFLAGPASSPSQAESSDSELEDPSASRLKERPPVPSPQPVHLTPGPSASLQATSLMPVSMATASPQPMMSVAGHGFQPYSYSQATTASSHLQPVGQIYPSQTVPYQGSGDVTSFLMTEARQHNTEIRLAVSKVGDKVDQLAAKVEELHRQGGGLPLGLSNVSMDTTMIMNTIQRIIQENECLKKEVFEKSSRIEEQNRKIGELINQNQRCMEQSNILMEQRNDSLKNTSEQNQARILQAEQDKARLTDELASSTARVSELQLELTAQRQKAAALQSSLSAALQEAQQHNAQLAATENQLQEMKETAERAQAQYRAEKQKRKELELKLSNLDEELQDVKSEKESVERTLSDRKRKWQAERQRCDEELEEVRKTSQVEMDQLRSQLRKARTNTDQAAAEQLSQLQADVEREWKAKCERALASAREQQHRDVTELTEQRDTLQLKLTQLQDKFSAMKQSKEQEEQRLLRQQDQGEELQALRDKCYVLEKRAESLRQQGEERVSELERRLAEQKGQTDTTGEVKRVMNGVFQSLRGEFELHETYTGSVVLGILVNTIKNVTLQLLSKSEPSLSEINKKEEEEEDEEEEEEDRRSETQSEEQENQAQELDLNGKKEDVEEEEEDGQEQLTEEKRNESETVEEDKKEEKGGQEVVKSIEKEKGGQEVVSGKEEEKDGQEVIRSQEEVKVGHEVVKSIEKEKGGQEVVSGKEEKKDGQEVIRGKVEETCGQEVIRGKEEETCGQEVIRGKEEEKDGQEVIRGKVEETCRQEVEGAKEEVKETGKESDRLKAEELVQQPNITTLPQVQNDVIPKQEVITGPLGEVTPEEEAVAETESTLRVLDESEADDAIHTGPPKNPPPPPNPAEEDGAETAAQPSSPSKRMEEVNSEQPFFQSPIPTKPPPLPTSEEEEEEEEEVSLKGRPPPTSLFGDDSDDDDLDWLS
ncbi:FK506-binding protein 15 isoform 2-T2 [Clarias gariepinus]|uniref:FK506-binding protein 15 isoform X2 n=1 Tax=Clarias gariepinus TaxID=13013 RepID=UPI00234C1A7E|nr:FK506-binding protein 15 isoform X2 [Clarias gariepinus]